MKYLNPAVEKIERAFRISRSLKKETFSLDDAWQAGVMREIRKIGSDSREFGFGAFLARYAWPMAPLTIVIIAMIAVSVIVTFNITDNYDLAETFFENPIRFAMTQILDM